MTNSNNTLITLSLKQRAEILASIKKRVLEHHINVSGVSHELWERLVDHRTPELLIADINGFESGIRQLLSELGSSHTVFYHERANRLLPQHSINATLRNFQAVNKERWIFLDVFAGGPAHLVGIKPGDMLLAIDGVSYAPPSIPTFNTGQAFTLSVSDIRGESVRDLVVAVPKRKGTKARPPIVEPKSLTHKMIQSNVGLLKITYFPGEMGVRFAKELDAAISDLKANGADRLIIDLRGNIGGGLGLARLASYMCPDRIPIGHSLTPGRLRTGYDIERLPRVPMPRSRAEILLTLARFSFRNKSLVLLTQGLGSQPFHNKIVLLVNEWTNSAAEMVAGFAAEHRLATIVGEKTAGNVLGAANFRVGSGYRLRLPIFGWYSPRGNCLEAKGVLPDVVVEVDPCLLSVGIDQQMDKALEILSGMENGRKTSAHGTDGDQP